MASDNTEFAYRVSIPVCLVVEKVKLYNKELTHSHNFNSCVLNMTHTLRCLPSLRWDKEADKMYFVLDEDDNALSPPPLFRLYCRRGSGVEKSQVLCSSSYHPSDTQLQRHADPQDGPGRKDDQSRTTLEGSAK